MDIASFFANYGLFILLAVLLVFMFWNSRKRMQKQKLEQEAKARQTVPGAEVLLQGGLYGTIVAYDPENLDQPAEVEIAPGTVIKVHSQAILRVVEPTAAPELDGEEAHDAPAIESIDDVAVEPTIDPETGKKKTED
ncbi:MAG TPA: preprotein translocase subunit YajC [Microbacterium sp.]|uniref:preprotein translocase subunit YajC n=1 Tax=Microbacterium sp. TaxID=51671 RepID=UPI002BC0110E|nr:preprotein translocase subunit YajC [Microbacterium sp.]HWI32062.1 preprotein translocase subunit YajC [Microbacterium sp.]